MNAFELSGVFCPIITPFSKGNVDLTELENHISWLLERQIDGIVPCGTSGEATSLTENEYTLIIENLSHIVNDRVPIIAGVASTNVVDALNRIEILNKYNVDATLVLPPYYHEPNSTEGVKHFFYSLADNSSLPIIMYNIPQVVGYEIDLEAVKELAEHETIIGIKNSSSDFSYFHQILAETPGGFLVFQGYDPLIVPGYQAGSDAVIAGLSNVVPEAFTEIFDAMNNGLDKRAIDIQQEIIVPFWNRSIEYGFPASLKACLKIRGVISTTEVRPPLAELKDNQYNELESLIDDLWETNILE